MYNKVNPSNKFYKAITGKKGFTLTEIITVLGITALLAAAVAAIFVPMRKIINDYNRDAYTDMAMQGIHTYIRKSLQEADVILITDNVFDEVFDSVSQDGVKCLAIYKNYDGKTRLCDLTPNRNDRIKYYDLPDYYEEYDVFSEENYCKKDYRFYFTLKQSDDYNWLELKLQSYSKNGNADSDMVRNFRILNENAVIYNEVGSSNADGIIYILYTYTA